MPIKYTSLLLALLLLGCAPAVPAEQSAPSSVTASASVEAEASSPTTAAETAGASHFGQLIVTDGQQLTLTEGVFQQEEPLPAILVQENSALLGQSLTISAPGTALALANGHAELTQCTLNGSVIAEGSCSVSLDGCALTPGDDGILFSLVDGQADLSMTGCSLDESAACIQLPSGTCTVTLASQELYAAFSIGDDAELTICLNNGAILHTAFDEDVMAYVAVELQEGALWVLTDDCYLEVLPGTADGLMEILDRIQSNGFTIYYNCDNAQNDYLAGKPYELPGGGYLSPLI